MAERVVLHVGTPKSGTTYLQTLLWENRERLAGAGVHLPLESRRDHFQAISDLAGNLRRVLPGVEPTTWERMAEAIAGTPGTALISEELLCSLEPEAQHRAIESMAGTPVTIVVTARDPFRQIPSAWQQLLKHGGVTPLATFVERLRAGTDQRWRRQQDVAAVLGRWAAAVGAAQVVVVTVPPRGASHELLWQRFAAALGVDAVGFSTPAAAANETLDSGQAELLRRMNVALDGRLPFPQPYVPVMRLTMVPALANHPLGGRLRVPAEHVDWVTQYAREAVAEIEDLGVVVRGDLADLIGDPPTGPDEPLDEDALDRVLLDVIADFAVGQAAAYAEIDRQRERINRQNRRIERLQQRVDKAKARSAALREEVAALRPRGRLWRSRKD